MIIGVHKNFEKQFVKLPLREKKQVKAVLLLFRNSPEHRALRNHPLKGKWHGYFSISAASDLRLHYYFSTPGKVEFVAVGSHSQLYK